MRGPLRAIGTYAQVLLADYGEKLDLKAVDCVERIERGATRLELLVRDVLSYSKVAKGQLELHGIALRPLIEDIIHQQPEFEARRECIAIEDPLPVVRGHEACLTQCFTNLIHNAFKFVVPGGTPSIRIWAEKLPGEARVWVSDKGIGIGPEHFDRIFQLFGQVYSEKRYPGTGIGLAIVKKAVTRMGGKCGFRSTLNSGSDFWFSLPFQE
jgi:signal transduction histidine kinase